MVDVKQDHRPLRIAMVAGEASGDLLGAELIRALKQYYPQAEFYGIGGAEMAQAGCRHFYASEQLAVMGLFAPLVKLPQILRIRYHLTRHLLANPPDMFIGIDAPDFNLGLELKLRQQGIRTVHCVSPSVWAWRQRRIYQIERAVDLMLVLFPFEEAFYQRFRVPVRYIGHPLADRYPLRLDAENARRALGYHRGDTIIALMPGSRLMELNYMAELFVRTARWCMERYPDLKFIAPMVNEARREQFQAYVEAFGADLPLQVTVGNTAQAITASNVVLLTSGTASLEAMLLKRPMVIAYQLSTLSFQLLKRLVKTEYIGLPNLIAGERLVPEFIQEEVQPAYLGAAILEYLRHPEEVQRLVTRFDAMHEILAGGASQKAAKAIVELIDNAT